jgi:cation diffusion facilitator family transporter
MARICKKCDWCAENVGAINLWTNCGLFAIKLIGGVFGRSQALIADAFHSVGDIIVSLLVLVGLKITGDPPDDDHPWGHGHIEFIVAAIIGTLLLFGAVMITVNSLMTVFMQDETYPSILAAWAALISIITNEVLFRHSLCIGKQSNSPAMISNAWEKKADVYSSMAALVGVFGARLGFSFLDPVAAIFVGFMIGKSGADSLVTAINGITDKAIDSDMLKIIRKILEQQKEVKNISRLRARRIGQKNWVDIEVSFDPMFKVHEVKHLIKKLKDRINEKVEDIGGIHIIPKVSV